jgi:hypothetical protein
VVDRSEPMTNLVAKKIIEIYQSGIRDPAHIAELAQKQFESK